MTLNVNTQCSGNTQPVNHASGMSLPTYPIGIDNKDQGSYHGGGNNLTNIPYIYLAFSSNTPDIYNADMTINLNPISLTWSDFLNMFFKGPSDGFYINPSNHNSKAISFNNQYYETTDNNNKKFNLKDQICKSWAKKFAKSESIISPQITIKLHRFGFLTNSLASINEYLIGLSLDEAIASLLSEDAIEPGDFEDVATVKFIVSSKITYDLLHTSILVNFTYIVQIPGYKNTHDLGNLNNVDKGAPRNLFNSYSADKSASRNLFTSYSADKTTPRNLAIYSEDKAISQHLPPYSEEKLDPPHVSGLYSEDKTAQRNYVIQPNNIKHSSGGKLLTHPHNNFSPELRSDDDSLIFTEISKLIKEEDEGSSEGSTQW